ERRIVPLLDKPLVCPHGNPIPGLEDLGLPFSSVDDSSTLTSLTAAATRGETQAVVDRISEQLQGDADVMRRLSEAGITPGTAITVDLGPDGAVRILNRGSSDVFDRTIADSVFVRLV